MAKTFQRRRSSIKKEFTEKELVELRTAFDLLDTNQDGKITPEELQLMLDKLGISVKAEAAHDLIKCASHAGDELIDENEFLHWVKRIQSLRPEEQVDDETAKNVMAAFKVFDLDNDGFITRDELRQAMSTIGETATEEQLSEFIELADMDKDGKINYEELCIDVRKSKKKWYVESIVKSVPSGVNLYAFGVMKVKNLQDCCSRLISSTTD